MPEKCKRFDVTRRDWLLWTSASVGLAASGSCGPGRLRADEDLDSGTGEGERVARIEAEARKAGLGRFGITRADHFLAVGDAPDGFRREALDVCEGLGHVFLKYLRDRGFQVEYPASRMTVVVLKDSKSYGSLAGEAPGKDLGGHFDLDGNRLVIFDFRPERAQRDSAARINTFTLVHETVHLLCFGTGLLNIARPPAKCITEGLATHFEMWRKRASAPVGGVNRPRLEAIRQASREDRSWIETTRLLVDDEFFDDAATAQLAYGQAWLTMYHLLSSRSLWPSVVAYLSDLREPMHGGDRIADFEKHLGPVPAMDERLQRLRRDLLRD